MDDVGAKQRIALTCMIAIVFVAGVACGMWLCRYYNYFH